MLSFLMEIKFQFSALTRECRMLNAECKIVVFSYGK